MLALGKVREHGFRAILHAGSGWGWFRNLKWTWSFPVGVALKEHKNRV
jgi:hypothetical protein